MLSDHLSKSFLLVNRLFLRFIEIKFRINSVAKEVESHIYFRHLQNQLPIKLKMIREELLTHYRSSRPEVFCKKGVLRNCAKFTGKHLCQSLFFNRPRPATLLKQRLWHSCFPVNFAKFLRIPFFPEHLRWLLLALYRL